MLAHGELSGCLRLLEAAQRLLDDGNDGGAASGASASPLAAVTANNLACYYRRKGQLESALEMLLKASDLEKRIAAPRGPADTQINLCVVFSELNRHGEAAAHAAEALTLMESEVIASCRLVHACETSLVSPASTHPHGTPTRAPRLRRHLPLASPDG